MWRRPGNGALTVWSAALAAPPDERIDALIQSDGATLADDVGAVPFPVLVPHSAVDPIFPYADVVARYDELPGPKYLLTLVGAAHATVGEDTATPADAIYREATLAFLNRPLRGGRGPGAPGLPRRHRQPCRGRATDAAARHALRTLDPDFAEPS